jgi:hypothetical protein
MVRDMDHTRRADRPEGMVKKGFKNIVNVCLPYFSAGWSALRKPALVDPRGALVSRWKALTTALSRRSRMRGPKTSAEGA